MVSRQTAQRLYLYGAQAAGPSEAWASASNASGVGEVTVWSARARPQRDPDPCAGFAAPW
jgi:hypothetical protein